MKKVLLALAVSIALAGSIRAGNDHDDDHDYDHNSDHHSDYFEFQPGTIVLTRSVYVGNASTITVGEVLPVGCVAATFTFPILGSTKTTSASVTCGSAIYNGTYPSLFNNDNSDGNFGISSPIFLDNLTYDGKRLGTLPIPSDQIVTSFSSKSELALNRSTDGKSLTFMAYRGGTGFLTGPNLLDVSASNTPGVVDPTNPSIGQYYRAVAEVDAHGHMQFTDGNAYSGDNGRAVIKGHWLYYAVGNDNNSGLSKTQLPETQVGVNLIDSTGAELLVPGQTAPVPPNINEIGYFNVTQVTNPSSSPSAPYSVAKPWKDNNFRGLTIYNNTLYVSKGSGSNGINTVYQVGAAGTLPSGATSELAGDPIKILPGFPVYLATGLEQGSTTAATPLIYPFGIWFADANTLYVADEGDDCTSTSTVAPTCPEVLNPSSTVTAAQAMATIYTHAQNQTTAGLQKWIYNPTTSTWSMAYVIQAGLNLGVTYTVPNNDPKIDPDYPSPTTVNAGTGLLWGPATDGLRNITGRVNDDGTVTIWAVTSTVSGGGDQGADPNQLVKVTDKLSATTLATGDGHHDRHDSLDHFEIIRRAKSGEIFRGVALAPADRDDHDHDHDHWN